jgi:hypothetical protein
MKDIWLRWRCDASCSPARGADLLCNLMLCPTGIQLTIPYFDYGLTSIAMKTDKHVIFGVRDTTPPHSDIGPA